VRVCANFVLHLVCWIAATLEAWLALRFAGAPLGFGVVLVIEGLLYAIRSVAFAVPNAVGVQEGAYIMLGGSFGLTPEMALALSLWKRARARALGLRVLGASRLLEGGRLWRRAGALESGCPSLPPFQRRCRSRCARVKARASVLFLRSSLYWRRSR